MEKTFNESVPKMSDAERQAENAQRAQDGEPQIPGAAGRESIPNKDAQEHDPKGGPGSSGPTPIQEPRI